MNKIRAVAHVSLLRAMAADSLAVTERTWDEIWPHLRGFYGY